MAVEIFPRGGEWGLKLTVLGASGTYPRPGGACSGYLVRQGSTVLVMDLGNGCLSRLQEVADITRLGGVVVSHLHVDHFGDIYPLYYALRFHPERPWGLRLLLPPGGQELLGSLLGEEGRRYLGKVFSFQELREGEEYRFGSVAVRAFPARHPVSGFCLRLQAGGRTLAYSGDTAPCPGVWEAAREADLFLCEATLPGEYEEQAAHGHLTAPQAGRLAAEAGARRLIITHVWPTFEVDALLREARWAFGGETLAAREGEEYEV